jgi:hypothetical protein
VGGAATGKAQRERCRAAVAAAAMGGGGCASGIEGECVCVCVCVCVCGGGRGGGGAAEQARSAVAASWGHARDTPLLTPSPPRPAVTKRTHLGAKGDATAWEQRGSAAAAPRVAGALLLVGLLATTPHFAACERAGCALRAAIGGAAAAAAAAEVVIGGAVGQGPASLAADGWA